MRELAEEVDRRRPRSETESLQEALVRAVELEHYEKAAFLRDRLKALLADPAFPRNNPNRLRALVGTFGMNNPTQFARADGEGFRFVTQFVADVDKRNPQVAARVLTAFRVWQTFEPGRRAAAESALKSLKESSELSRNAADILDRTLNG